MKKSPVLAPPAGAQGAAGTTVGSATARLIADRNDVAIVELDGNYDETLANGDINDGKTALGLLRGRARG